MLCVKMAHIIKVTLYIHINLAIGSSFQVLKRIENLTERVSKIQFAERKSSVTSLTHHRITQKKNFKFGVDMKFHVLFL